MHRNGTELTVAVDGRLNTLTVPDLEKELQTSMDGVEKLKFDFEKLEYISSAGLRLLLSTMQAMEDKGEMSLCNVRPEIMEVFEMTGFIEDLTIE